jgi:hypothetical protein
LLQSLAAPLQLLARLVLSLIGLAQLLVGLQQLGFKRSDAHGGGLLQRPQLLRGPGGEALGALERVRRPHELARCGVGSGGPGDGRRCAGDPWHDCRLSGRGAGGAIRKLRLIMSVPSTGAAPRRERVSLNRNHGFDSARSSHRCRLQLICPMVKRLQRRTLRHPRRYRLSLLLLKGVVNVEPRHGAYVGLPVLFATGGLARCALLHGRCESCECSQLQDMSQR